MGERVIGTNPLESLLAQADAALARARANVRPADAEGYTVHDFARAWKLTREGAYRRVRVMVDGGELKASGKKWVPWGGAYRAVQCYQFVKGKK